jgi:hypothetical protein
MENADLLRTKKLFEENNFDWVYGNTLPKAPCFSDKNKKRYVVNAGDTLESIANDIVGNKQNRYTDISSKFKNYQKNTNNAPWKFLAEYNYGTSVISKINWVCCEYYGFDDNSNITTDKKSYMFKGGEVLYYPICQPILSGTEKVGIASTDVPGYILFPSFATPSIVQNNGKISLIILSKDALTTSMVNSHLKIVSWSDPDGESVCMIKDISFNDPQGYKGYKNLLTSNPSGAGISCCIIKMDETIIDNDAGNAFIPDAGLISSLNSIGLRTLNKVCIDLIYLTDIVDGFYNLFWINQGQELEDLLLQQRLSSENFLGKRIQKHSNGYYYGWEVEENSFYLENISSSLPVAAYHPLLITNKDYCNFAHLGDLHCVSRLSLLKLSTAKVIDHPDIEPIGSLLNDYVSTVRNLLFQEDKLHDVDAFLISGDLIDFMYNFYPVELIAERERLRGDGKNAEADMLTAHKFYNTPAKVWNAAGVGNESDVMKKYAMGVDLITLYSMILELYQKLHKPVFIVTGNHDAYEMPYGVSPRLPVIGKVNAGIPADMNLTFYEAILVYGKHYGEVVKKTNFTPDRMRHIYELFTPLRDFVVSNNNWTLIGLGWGDGEDLIDIPLLEDEGFRGHLPRANNALTIPQRQLFDFAARTQKTKILFSHFTFVSFGMGIPSRNNPSGEIQYNGFGRQDMGTFELHRKEIYKHIVEDQKIEIALSGHAHRRGLYEIDRSINESAIAIMRTFSETAKVHGTKIVVSDSSGPISKYNENGEFSNNGLCTPSITKVKFNANGKVATLEKIISTNPNAKPRLAVALDYMYVIAKQDIFKSFKSKEYTEQELKNLSKIEFEIELTENFYNLEILCEKITIYFQYESNCDVYPFNFESKRNPVDFGTNKRQLNNKLNVSVNKKKVFTFIKQVEQLGMQECCTYLSFLFKSSAARIQNEYNCKSPYIIQTIISRKFTGFFNGTMYFDCKRDVRCKEIPDFKTKKKLNPIIY